MHLLSDNIKFEYTRAKKFAPYINLIFLEYMSNSLCSGTALVNHFYGVPTQYNTSVLSHNT